MLPSNGTPVLLCTTKYYSSTTLFYKVLLQYYPVLQSTTPVLPCTTKYLLQYYLVLQSSTGTTKYYSVLQSTTPVLPCTTKYDSSTNLYYKVVLCTTKYYSSTTLYYKVLHDWSASHMKRHLQCAEQQKAASNFSKYCDCHAKWISWLIRIAYETSFTMRRATGITLQLHQPATQNESHDWSTSHMKRHLQCAEQQSTPSQPHQILRLPRKMNLMIDPRHIWNVIYNARSNSQHPPTSPNTAPATQNESHDWSTSHMKRHLQCAEQQSTPSNFSKYCDCHAKWISWLIRIAYETSFTLRRATGITLQLHQPATQNESHDWSTSHMKRHLQCAEQQSTPSNLTKYCACHAKWISWLIHVTYETSFTMRGATVNTLQPHQILRLPRKMSLMIDPHHIWNVIYNARSNSQHPPTSANTAIATQNESHDWSASHMKRHLQCAEQQASPSNFTKYCACHAKWHSQILEKFTENSWSGISNARPIRPWSENIRDRSNPENAKLNPPRRQGYSSHSPGAGSIENYNVSRSGYHSKFHHMLRLPRKVTHELCQMLHLPQKVTHELHQMLHLPRKVRQELQQILHRPQKVTHELQQMLHLPQKMTHELHQMLHLPQKMTHELQQMLHLPHYYYYYYHYYYYDYYYYYY